MCISVVVAPDLIRYVLPQLAHPGEHEAIIEEDLWETVKAYAIVQEYRREFGTNPGRMPLQAIVFSAKKPS